MAVKIDLVKKRVMIGVGDLVAEPLAALGRVAGLSTWTRMALGREAHVRHQAAQADLHAGYAREIAVKFTTTVDEFAVTVQGRIDGVIAPVNGGMHVVEEIKSVVMPPLMFAALAADAYPQYVEQLRLYCFFVEQQQGAALGRLVFINVADAQRREFEFPSPFGDVAEMIATRVRALITHTREEERQREERRATARTLVFPHEKPRPSQTEMIAAVERALAAGRDLLVTAPSGVGKTAGALFPVVKYALANDKRVFFVTAKNTQHANALGTLWRMGLPSGVAWRAREKMCINNVYACREEFCAHLRDFTLKLERTQALERLLGRRVVTADDFMEAGRGASLCPFELALMGAERADVIVCDYNYVFDPQVYLRRFFLDADYSDAILVIDEAHNLVQRALDYYSPSLGRRQLRAVTEALRQVEPSLRKEFRVVVEELNEFLGRMVAARGDEYSQVEEQQAEKFLIESPRGFFEELRPEMNRLSVRYLLNKLSGGRAIPDDPIEEFLSEFGQFSTVLGMEGEEFSYVFDTTEQAVKVVCKDASRMLAGRLEGFHSVIGMSATLEPVEFYRQMLGFTEKRTDMARFSSPFPQENRKIVVERRVMTTYRGRQSNYGKIAEIIATTAGARRGNYMALFPSYDFLRSVAACLPVGDWELKVQESRMTEPQREEVLTALRSNDPPKLVLAVQGGVFAEGVDYPGEVLSGVVVVSPALPQVSFERELMREYYEAKYGKGFEFAYLYPGMNRVIQSVGRLIRSETDCGVAVLVCQRFATAPYSALFPVEWSNGGMKGLICNDLEQELQTFWKGVTARKQTLTTGDFSL